MVRVSWGNEIPLPPFFPQFYLSFTSVSPEFLGLSTGKTRPPNSQSNRSIDGKIPCKPTPPEFRGWQIHPLNLGGGVSKALCFTVFFDKQGSTGRYYCRKTGRKGQFCRDTGCPGTPGRPGRFQKSYVIFSHVSFLLPISGPISRDIAILSLRYPISRDTLSGRLALPQNDAIPPLGT